MPLSTFSVPSHNCRPEKAKARTFLLSDPLPCLVFPRSPPNTDSKPRQALFRWAWVGRFEASMVLPSSAHLLRDLIVLFALPA